MVFCRAKSLTIPPMVYLFGAFAAFFFLAERLFPLRPDQGIFRRGFWTDILYIPIHFFMRVFLKRMPMSGHVKVFAFFYFAFTTHHGAGFLISQSSSPAAK